MKAVAQYSRGNQELIEPVMGDLGRVLKVIRSCETIAQLSVASNYARLSGVHTMEVVLFEILWKKLKIRGQYKYHHNKVLSIQEG